MSEALHNDYRMTLEAFHAFIAARPHWEKWELIDGEAIMQATPAKRHQIIVSNLLLELNAFRRATDADWLAIGGIGTRVPADEHNEIIPDVMILPPGDDTENWTFEVLAAFEVLSPGSVRRDMVRKRDFYSRIKTLTHYFVLAQDRREATLFARDQDFSPRLLRDDDILEIPPLGVMLPLDEIYRNVRLD
jgi:Uma2 family endonuclease